VAVAVDLIFQVVEPVEVELVVIENLEGQLLDVILYLH
jgi:hypothetical protein